MTESSETPNKSTPAMMFTTGQTVTVMRGKTRGKQAEVLAVDAGSQMYSVRYEDGTLGVINAVNVKVPAEATIAEGKLAAEIQTAVNDNVHDVQTYQALVSRLSSDLPGLGARVSWPAVAE